VRQTRHRAPSHVLEDIMTLNLVIATTAMLGLIAGASIIAQSGSGSGSGAGAGAGSGSTETPFFCNLKALTGAERTEHQQATKHLLASVQETRELPNGYAFTVDGSRVSIKDLATFVDFERRCCPFFDFHLEWRRENGPVTLQLTGREGVKEFIRAEFTPVFRKQP
jgi:hypothetical protein